MSFCLLKKEGGATFLLPKQLPSDIQTLDELEYLGKLSNLKERSYIIGDPEELVHIDWFDEWDPECI